MSKYVPKPDPEGINSPLESTPIKDVAILLVGFISIIFIIYFALGAISDFALTKISLDTEMRVLNKIWDRGSTSDQNPKVFTEFIDGLNKHVGFPLNVSVICDKDPNAFALPGGKVLLTSGLLNSVKSENGLAFVLAHEVGHFINRDHIRGLGRKILFQLGASLLGIPNDLSATGAVSFMIDRSFDRNQETNADEYALSLVQKVYGHAWGAEEFFVAVQAKETELESSFSRFVSTHPMTDARIARIKAAQTGAPADLKLPERPFSEWVSDFDCSTKE